MPDENGELRNCGTTLELIVTDFTEKARCKRNCEGTISKKDQRKVSGGRIFLSFFS